MIPQRPEHGLPPLPPGFDPKSMPKSSRYQRFEYDQSQNKTAILKALAATVIGIATIALWKGQAKGTDEALGFLTRYGITLVGAMGIYLFCCFGLFEYCGPLLRAFFGVAGSLALSLLIQHIASELPLIGWLGGIPWFLGFITFLGTASTFLELEIQEAGLYALFVLGIRLILKFALFDQMFAS